MFWVWRLNLFFFIKIFLELFPEGGEETTFNLNEVVSICKVLKEVAVGIISLAFPSVTMHGFEQRIDVLTPTKHVEFNTLAWRTLLEVGFFIFYFFLILNEIVLLIQIINYLSSL